MNESLCTSVSTYKMGISFLMHGMREYYVVNFPGHRVTLVSDSKCELFIHFLSLVG